MRVVWLKDLRLADLPQVGGKNASLGEMTAALSAAGIRVPGGFATTADAFREFLVADGLDRRIDQKLKSLDCDDVNALAACGKEIRSWIEKAPFPVDLERDIRSHYQKLEETTSGDASFAVRERRAVHPRHRIGLPRRGVHHFVLRAGRDAGPGRRQSGRVLRPQAAAGARQACDRAPGAGLQAPENGFWHRARSGQVDPYR